jgi:hypothetical protein
MFVITCRGDAQIAGSGFQTAEAEQELNRADVGAGLKEMDGERMPEGMWGDGFGEACPATRVVTGLFDRAASNRVVGPIPGKQPEGRSAPAPPVAQHLEPFGREDHVAIRCPLPCSTRMIMRALSISRSRRFTASETQAGGVAGRQDPAVLRRGDTVQHADDFVGAYRLFSLPALRAGSKASYPPTSTGAWPQDAHAYP